MRLFFKCYTICETLSQKLNWSHICELVKINDELERSFYEKQKYVKWNDWEEGVGDHWKTSWKCERQYI